MPSHLAEAAALVEAARAVVVLPHAQPELRRATVDLAFSADARLLQSRAFKGQAYPKSLRDERDLSYQRPLDLDEPPAEIW